MLKLLLYEAGTKMWPICNLIWQLPIYTDPTIPIHTRIAAVIASKWRALHTSFCINKKLTQQWKPWKISYHFLFVTSASSVHDVQIEPT